MRKYKVRIFTLITAFALTMGAAFLALPKKSALAASYAPKNIFSVTNGAEVGASDDKKVQFTLKDGASVNYRHDLALKWYTEKDTPEYLKVEFALPAINFDSVTLTFESAQENVTKDGKTTNKVIFTPVADDATKLNVSLNDSQMKDVVTLKEGNTVAIALKGDNGGDFTVNVNDVDLTDKLTNIGGYYMEYLSSASSTPRIPLTFEADVKEGADSQLVKMVSLNGQKFNLAENGEVEDDTAPVLVVNEKLRAFPIGHKFNVDCIAVDVLDDTVTTSRNYEYLKLADGETIAQAKEAKDLAYEKSLTADTYLVGQKSGSPKENVAIRFSLADDRTLNDEQKKAEYIYLSWYCEKSGVQADDDALDKGYIPVLSDDKGVEYTFVKDELVETNKYETKIDATKQTIIDGYQTEVDAAAKNLKVGKGAYFYLPSLREMFQDTYTDYGKMKFTVYYMSKSGGKQSATSLAYNALRFEVDKEGEYLFRVVAEDQMGNGMKVYDEDNELVKISSDNVWDLECVPQFSFTAVYTGAEIEQPKEQAIGYIDSQYTVSSFDITAVEGYTVKYELYYFNQAKFTADGNDMPTYASMVKNPEQIAVAENGAYKYLTQIQEYDDTITEEDEAAWEKSDNAVEWKSGEMTFRPQEAGFYFVKAEVTDAQFPQDKAVSYQVIEVQNKIDVIEGETYWLQNNITAVILFSISGLLLIAIIVLWLVKPSDKQVEEVELSQLKGQKKVKKEKKEKKSK